VFKKLDILVIKAFIGPFLATFFITLLVLIMQFFWLYIDDFVSKGLDTKIIFEFILYLGATLVPLALPLAVLLSSLMTFGNLGESFELVAIKSSGISLLRFMRPLFFISILIGGVAFVFANYVIPVATLKQRTLLSDIVWAKPAFDLKEGVFYDRIPGFAIKVGKKEDNDSIIRDVIVYEQGNNLQDNFIIAKSGVMRVTANRRFLEFNLKDGYRYQEKGNTYQSGSEEFIRIGFKEYNKQFDLGSLGFNNRTADSVNRNNEKMYSLRQLTVAIDSLEKEAKRNKAQGLRDILIGYPFAAYYDTIKTDKLTKKIPAITDTVKSFEKLLPDSAKSNISQTVRSSASTIKITFDTQAQLENDRQKILRRHKIEWHRKITLSLACIVLFLIGAPLGSIIRKGGIGTPLIFAIAFFMVFYFSSTTGEKMAKENSLTPFTGMWLATFVLLPIGLFLIYKALHDSNLFNKELYRKVFGGIKKFLGKRKKGSSQNA
jgi:lipopolysaccharide export system permease protein